MPTNILPPVYWEKTKWPKSEQTAQTWWDVLPHRFARICVLKAKIKSLSLLSEINQDHYIKGEPFITPAGNQIDDLYEAIFYDSYAIVEFLSRSDLPVELQGDVQVDLCVYDCGLFNTAHRVYQKDDNDEYILDENGKPILDENEPLIHGFWNNPWMAFCPDDIVLVLYDPVQTKNKSSIPLGKRLIIVGHSDYDGIDGPDNPDMDIITSSGVNSYILINNKVLFVNNNYVYLLNNSEKEYPNKNELISIDTFFNPFYNPPSFTNYYINLNTCNIITYRIILSWGLLYGGQQIPLYRIKATQYKALRNVILNKPGNNIIYVDILCADENDNVICTEPCNLYYERRRFNNIQYLDDNGNTVLIHGYTTGAHIVDKSDFKLARIYFTPVFNNENVLININKNISINEGVMPSDSHYYQEYQDDYIIFKSSRYAKVNFIDTVNAHWSHEVSSSAEYKSNVRYISNGCDPVRYGLFGSRYQKSNTSMITKIRLGTQELIFNNSYNYSAFEHLYADCEAHVNHDDYELLIPIEATGTTILFFNAAYNICIYAVSSVSVNVPPYNFQQENPATYNVQRNTYLLTLKEHYLLESKNVSNVNGGYMAIPISDSIYLPNFGTFTEPSNVIPFAGADGGFNIAPSEAYGTNLDVTFFYHDDNAYSLGYPIYWYGSADLKTIYIKFPLLSNNLKTDRTADTVYNNAYSVYHCYFLPDNNYKDLLIVNDKLATDSFDPNNFGVNNCGYMPIP